VSTTTDSATWLTDQAQEELGHDNQVRLAMILQDLVTLPYLRYTYVLDRSGGVCLSHPIGPNGKVVAAKHRPDAFLHLVNITELYLVEIEQNAPAHVTVDTRDEMLFIASAGPWVLVAAFEGQATRGYLSMKLTKRISHLRSMFRTMEIQEDPSS